MRLSSFFLFVSLLGSSSALAGEPLPSTHVRGPVTTAQAHEFKAWRADDGDIVVARRAPGAGTWDALTVASNPGIGKSDKVVVGVSEDGAVHLAYDAPGDTIRYLRTSPGVASAAGWSAGRFSDARLPAMGQGSTASVTMFARHGGGPLTLTFKEYEARRSLVQQATWNGSSWKAPTTLASMGFRVVAR